MLTTGYVPGAPSWIDLGTPDVDAASAFYGTLFGWAYLSAGPQAGGYGMFVLGEKVVAAIGPLGEDSDPSAWNLYFETADVDATAKAVEQAGGSVRLGPVDVFTAGRTAAFADPDGVAFSVWQPGERKGLDAVNELSTLCWTELLTDDPAAARTFYGAVLGWRIEDAPVEATGYGVISPPGGGPEASQGGILPLDDKLREAGLDPRWIGYFEVDDCDGIVALAEAKGGSVVTPAMTTEGVGRLALLADPFGARFAVIAGSPSAS